MPVLIFSIKLRGIPQRLLSVTGHLTKNHFCHIYDLGEAWKEMTGLPFVFAAWISNKELDPGWVERFDQANAFGVQNIPQVIEQIPDSFFDLKKYYTRYLSYDLDDEKKKGLNLFLKMLADKKYMHLL